ncbi:MAG: glycosyltransferase family 2 protein [Bacteroidales bacterium]
MGKTWTETWVDETNKTFIGIFIPRIQNMTFIIQKKFSLILATKDREIELIRFLEALRLQTYTDYELLIVDQNLDDRIQKIISDFSDIPIHHLHSEPGLSKARNVGLQHAKGEIIAFPDDDCWYKNDLLFQVNHFFSIKPDIAALTGRTMSDSTTKKVWKWDTESGYINKKNIWQRSNSNSIFIHQTVLSKPLLFNEMLGVGSGTPFGSGEEVDLLLQILEAGKKIVYEPKIIVGHEDAFPVNNEKAIQKTFSYASGMGYVLRDHQYPIHFIAMMLLKPFLNTIRNFLLGQRYRARFMWAMFSGRLYGIIQFGKIKHNE